MTQPDGLFPDSAFNFSSLAELAGRPQSEWEAQIRGQSSNGFEMVLGALFGPLPADLKEGIEFTRAVITAIIRQILNLPGQIWDSVEDALAALGAWVSDIPIIGDILSIINDTFSALFGGVDFTDLPSPGEVWQTVINTLMLPLNLLLGPSSPLNALNIFGRLQLPQFGGGVPLSALTPSVPNELEPFSATSVPTADGWSYDAVADAAKVVCDGSTKMLYLSGAAIKVEEGQPLNIAQKVRYTGVTSAAGQTIQYVLHTFTSDDGSGTATPVVVAGINNPSGTASTVTIGDTSWDPPVGVGSVYPVLVVDEDVTAGTVFWENTPSLKKGLDSVLAGGLPAALGSLGDWIEALVDQMLGALGLPALGTLFDKITDLSDEIGDWLTDTLGTQSDLADLIGDLLANPAAVLGSLPQSLISGLATSLANAGQDIRDAIVQAMGGTGTGHTATDVLNALLNIPQTAISNLEDDLADAGDAIADVFDDVRDGWNKFWDGIFKTTGSTGKTAADVQTAALEVINTATAAHVNVETANAAVATWQSQFTQQQLAQPLWLTGADGTCEVTVPLGWCQFYTSPVSAATAAFSCASGSHSHTAGAIAVTATDYYMTPVFAPAQIGGTNFPAGSFVGGVIRCRGGDLKDTISAVGTYGAGARFVIYEMDVSDGSVALLYESANLTASGTFGPIVHEMPSGSEFITTVGQVLIVGIWAPVGISALFSGCPMSQGFKSSSTAFPKSIGVKDTGWSTNAPTSMSDGDFTYMFLSNAGGNLDTMHQNTVPYFGIGSASPPAPLVRRRFVSQFATSGVSDWVNVTGTFGTINGELSSSALAAGVYKDALATDSPGVEIHLSPTRTVGKTRIAVKSNADMSQWIGIELDRTSTSAMTAKIVTGTGPNSGLTTRFTSGNVSTTVGPIEADPITGDQRNGGEYFRVAYTQANNTYELFTMNPLYRTWSSLGTWVDSGGFTTHGLAYRYGGAVTGVSGSPNKGQAVTKVEFYDL